MDPIAPILAAERDRRRRRRLFRHRKVPVRLLVPNFFTLLGLCAGLTSIRMSIEERYELALIAIVFAAFLDGIDGRVARLLKASSRFGAELDSLADFVNFGVAPAFIVFIWGFGDARSAGWICVLVFALASALRLARFNVASIEDRPAWQASYFVGVPTPAAAILVLLPIYLHQMGIDVRATSPGLYLLMGFTLFVALLMVSTMPTYSGKLVGERISRELVLPVFVLSVGYVALLVTFPYPTLALTTALYLASIPLSWRSYNARQRSAAGQPLNLNPLAPEAADLPAPKGFFRRPDASGGSAAP